MLKKWKAIVNFSLHIKIYYYL